MPCVESSSPIWSSISTTKPFCPIVVSLMLVLVISTSLEPGEFVLKVLSLNWFKY